MPVPPITLSADICNGSYQKFYLLLMEIPRSPDIQTKLKELSTSFTDKDRAEKPQNYERAMANVINAIFDVATTTIDKRFLMKAYCSDDVTLLKTDSADFRCSKCDPGVVIVPARCDIPVRLSHQKKYTLQWRSIRATGEAKPKHRPKFCELGELQVFTCWRQMVIADLDRISEQAFTCCGGTFRYYHFDAEGFATSDEYDIAEEPLLFVNHILLLSTFFTENFIRDQASSNSPRGSLICTRRAGIRGRRLAVYKIDCEGSPPMVEKNYWSTVRAPVPQEVQVYQHVEHTVNKGLHSDHVTRMLDFKIITSTAHIRRAFGIKSVAPKEHVRITLDWHGTSLENTISSWLDLTQNDKMKQLDCFLKMNEAVVAAIKGSYSILSFRLVSDHLLGAESLLHLGIRHGDISPGNICIADNGKHFLTDLGLASVVGDKYMAPASVRHFCLHP